MIMLFPAAFRALAVCLALAGGTVSGGTVLAHEGHDHGAEAQVAPVQVGPVQAAPRASARSDAFELVAVAGPGRIRLYLDRFVSNEPVAGAALVVETPDGAVEATALGDGLYEIPAPWLSRSRHHDLLATIAGDGRLDVLALDLELPEPIPASATVAATEPPAWLAHVRHHLTHQGPIGAAGGGFLLGLTVIMLLRSRRSLPALAVLAVTLTLLFGGAALAHDGEHGGTERRHDPAAAPHHAAVQGTALLDSVEPSLEPARRLPDGAVFVPKSTQRLLSVRTGLTGMAEHRRTVELPGRVIADPNASGVVQSSVGGRLAPPPGGFPNLGAKVRKGDVLGTVTPPVQAVDQSDMRQTQGDLDQQIAITGPS